MEDALGLNLQTYHSLEYQEVSWTTAGEFYGAGTVAAEYCSVEPFRPLRGTWQHGWIPSHLAVHPELVIMSSQPPQKRHYCWVARKDQALYLHQRGFKKAKAIGLPIVYLKEENINRIPGSLLVMPPHSNNATTHDWDFASYAEEIARLKKEFSNIVISIHPIDWAKGYWIDDFRRYGFDIIQGINGFDKNALKRLQILMSSFEYVTTNSFGSAIAYAAYFGAKVSIFGRFAQYKEEDIRNDPLCVRAPEMIQPLVTAISEKELRSHYPKLFCHPLEARENTDWACIELGHNNKVTPEEMRYLFGFNLVNKWIWQMRRKLPAPIKRTMRNVQASFRSA